MLYLKNSFQQPHKVDQYDPPPVYSRQDSEKIVACLGLPVLRRPQIWEGEVGLSLPTQLGRGQRIEERTPVGQMENLPINCHEEYLLLVRRLSM